ncbi:MAG: histidine phosphatase family protein [Candidatus Saccharibacteria bacterium]|nr:histidine phosphatase family protein [Candidatus Saccharibacteria bacterium]
MKILFVRHGKSLANAALTIGEPNTPLAEEGLEQARVTGQDLKGENVTLIACSPFIRAQQTAEIIAGELGIPIHDITIVDELHERRMGDLEGGPKIHETEYFYQNDTEHGFEPQAELIARMQTALAKVKGLANQTAGATVVVGHATSGFYFLQVAKGRTRFQDFDPVNQMNNAEFIEVSLGAEHA